MNQIEAVIFDMDGVLIDARDWHYDALNESLGIFGLNISRHDHLNMYNGLSTKKKLSILSESLGLPTELHEVIEAVKQDRTLRIAAQKCFPQVAHQVLLTRLKSHGIKLGLVTNSIRKTTEFMMEYAGLLDFMDVIITNEDVSEGKPNPEGYVKAMQFLGVNSSKTIVVEDGEYGIIAATASGAKVVKVKDPSDVNLDLLIPFVENLR